MFEVKVDIPALEKLAEAILVLAGAQGDAPKAAPAKAKPAAKPKAEPTAEAAESTSTEDSQVASPSDVPSADALKKAAVGLSAKNGRDALEAALKDHGATAGISSIPDDRKAAFVEHCLSAVA